MPSQLPRHQSSLPTAANPGNRTICDTVDAMVKTLNITPEQAVATIAEAGCSTPCRAAVHDY